MKKVFVHTILIFLAISSCAQFKSALSAEKWVDSVFKTLSDDQKIGQLIVVRLSAIDMSTKKVTFYDKEVEDAVRKFNVGGICLFQGGPVTQANYINYFQSIAQTP
ncbi:MAG TPA: hypothetical protein VNV85_17930, partial [Puia sp.]|nr:hypothetical protein [Puia sp.]